MQGSVVVAVGLAPVRSERGLTIVPDIAFEEVPPLDIVCLPGGVGSTQ